MSIFAKPYLETIGAHGAVATIGAGATLWLTPYLSGLQAAALSWGLPIGCIASTLRFRIGSAQPPGGTLTCTMTLDGVLTALVVTVPAGGGIATYEDLVNRISIPAAGRVGWQLTNNAGAVSAQIGFVSMLLSSS